MEEILHLRAALTAAAATAAAQAQAAAATAAAKAAAQSRLFAQMFAQNQIRDERFELFMRQGAVPRQGPEVPPAQQLPQNPWAEQTAPPPLAAGLDNRGPAGLTTNPSEFGRQQSRTNCPDCQLGMLHIARCLAPSQGAMEQCHQEGWAPAPRLSLTSQDLSSSSRHFHQILT